MLTKLHGQHSLIKLASHSSLSHRAKCGCRQLQNKSSMKSQASLIKRLPSYHSGELADRDALNSQTGLQSLAWLDKFRADPANEPVLTAGAVLSNNAKLPPDHMVSPYKEQLQTAF